jgi:hypothetical protein
MTFKDEAISITSARRFFIPRERGPLIWKDVQPTNYRRNIGSYTDNAILPTQVNASDVIQFCSTINDIVAIEEECPEN